MNTKGMGMSAADATMQDEIVVLGTGKSVNNLTRKQVEYLNRQPIRIGINKYTAFHYLVGVIPNRVWFTDLHPPNNLILEYLADTTWRYPIQDARFILSRGWGTSPQKATFSAVAKQIARTVFQKRQIYFPRSRRVASAVRTAIRLPGARRIYHGAAVLCLPHGCDYQLVQVDLANWNTGKAEWATRPDQPLYQWLTSFTTVLNYISVYHPGAKVRLVGTDFNSAGYFFDAELSKLNLRWDDWTSPLQRTENKHFAAIDTGGRPTLYDRMPEILNHLRAANIRLTCANPNSDLVLRGYVPYECIPE